MNCAHRAGAGSWASHDLPRDMISPEALAGRRDLFLLATKVLLGVCAASWLGGIVFYDISADRPNMAATLLLPTRTAYILLLAKGETVGVERIWGGPATLLGLECLAGTLGTAGLFLLVRRRLRGGSLSRPGLAFACAGMFAGSLMTKAGAAAYPVTVTPASFDQLVAFIAQRQPTVLTALRAGERTPLGAGRPRVMHGTIVSGEGSTRALPDAGDQPLRDGFDTEALRFALAQQAADRGDLPALRRLLPIALAMPPTDRPARNDFARRLVRLGAIAGMPPVPPTQRDWVWTGDAAWRRALAWVHVARIILQVTLLTGSVSLTLSLLLRRRYRRLERYRETLAAAPRAAARARPTFGRAR